MDKKSRDFVRPPSCRGFSFWYNKNKMNIKNLFLIIVLLILGFGGYFLWLQTKYRDTEKLTGINCPQTLDRYEVLAEYLVDKINSEPKSTTVLKGFRQLDGEVTSSSINNLFILIRINSQGEIDSFVCKDNKIYIHKDPSQDVLITIPEDDFKNIVQNIDNLEESQAVSYMRNITTDPASVRKTIIERILNSPSE
ncbi:MAG: hypothetical protein NT135_00780 [Candidatus Berkelbacteria bacterium]|nr:hypothetical protein [Candidatus Berkelbacteria bacterium]